MRALLVVNPKATTTTQRVREVIARALASELKLEVVETGYRGHAAALALRGARDGVDLVVAVGGDGTVNEVVNGLLTDGPMLATLRARENGPAGRVIGLGKAGSRWFTFTAGLGLDAEVVHRMERRRRAGRPTSHLRYVRATLSQFYFHTDRRQPALTLELPGEEPATGLFLAIVSNTTPWTFLNKRPIRPSPEASFETGLDLFSLRRMRTLTMFRHARQMLRRRPRLRGRHLVTLHDLSSFSLRSDRPLGFQVDGDYLGEREQVTFDAVPAALRVVI